MYSFLKVFLVLMKLLSLSQFDAPKFPLKKRRTLMEPYYMFCGTPVEEHCSRRPWWNPLKILRNTIGASWKRERKVFSKSFNFWLGTLNGNHTGSAVVALTAVFVQWYRVTRRLPNNSLSFCFSSRAYRSFQDQFLWTTHVMCGSLSWGGFRV